MSREITAFLYAVALNVFLCMLLTPVFVNIPVLNPPPVSDSLMPFAIGFGGLTAFISGVIGLWLVIRICMRYELVSLHAWLLVTAGALLIMVPVIGAVAELDIRFTIAFSVPCALSSTFLYWKMAMESGDVQK